MCGVLVIALPVSVLGTNFTLFYTYAKARLNLPPKAEQKQPLSKELTSLKAKKTELIHPGSSFSCNSIAKKYEQAKLGSLEYLAENHNDKQKETSHKSTANEGRANGSAHEDSHTVTVTDPDVDLTPSFRECTFDFLDVPVGTRLKRSFLSNSISRMLGAITHHSRQEPTLQSTIQLDVHSTYPLYLRRDAVAPGSISSRSLSSTIYDSGSSNLPKCVKQSVKSLRRKQKLNKRLGSERKCISNAELHLVCFHRCEKHPNKEQYNDTNNNCSCPSHSSAYSKSRLAKSCSELNDILQGNYQNSLPSMDNDLSSGDIHSVIGSKPQSFPLTDIAITINGCSDDGSSVDHNTPLLRSNNPENKGMFLKPCGGNNQWRNSPHANKVKKQPQQEIINAGEQILRNTVRDNTTT